MHRKAPHGRVRIVGDQLALEHVRVLDDLRNIIDGAYGDLLRLKETHVFGLGAITDKGADDGVELRPVLYALRIGPVSRIGDQIGTADRAKQPLSHFLGRRREADPKAIAGAVSVAGSRI